MDEVKVTVDGDVTFKFKVVEYGHVEHLIPETQLKGHLKRHLEKYLMKEFDYVEILEINMDTEVEGVE